MTVKEKKVNTKNTPVRERILSTAVELFYKHGINCVGVDRIVEEARVAKMTLYSYFPSKEDLIHESLEKISEKWFKDFHKYLNRHCSTDKQRLLGSFHYLKKIYDESENFRGLATVNAGLEISDPYHPVHGLILDQQEKLRECFENWAYNSGLSDARTLSYTLVMLFNGAAVTAVLEDFPEPVNQAVSAAKKIIDQAWA